MPKVNIFITSITAERLWDIDKAIPGQIHISINVNIMDFEKRSNNSVEEIGRAHV